MIRLSHELHKSIKHNGRENTIIANNYIGNKVFLFPYRIVHKIKYASPYNDENKESCQREQKNE